MKIIEPSSTLEEQINGMELIKKVERAGRTCYKSEDQISEVTAMNFVKKIITSGHESVLEHEKITVRVVCDRGVSHEIVRHRIASYSQESTRYCNYSKDRFNNELTFIKPYFWEDDSKQSKEKYLIWKSTMETIEKNYFELIKLGAEPQQARSILPNSLKTEIVMTMNLREWRHFFRLRTTLSAHPQIRQIARPLLDKFKEVIPVVFDDIEY
ncbi:FAD-dependent thymidylate synthase [Desulfosporosinus sp. FKB]|uniref:FAD-dependent thymidylate synthase n=1 Tax=Desulfosporosinus sp. FKB TaxID=1969835 RepID=UPI000B49EDBC|nr:FAD-dependent thymidylate synthase [Desulfosporosinus sp. FKB]